jgi:dipeptidyl aminopeptidase/acylaminoacyl peptidase
MDGDAGLEHSSNQDGLSCEPPPPAEALQGGAPVHSQEVTRNRSGDLAIRLSRDDDGTRLWAIKGHSIELLFETDRHLAEIAPGRCLTVRFERPDGTRAAARCILPPDYRAGEARPAVMWVYPGTTIVDRPSAEHHLNYSGFFNLQLLAACGYVVIVPEIPDDGGRDLVDDLAASVCPALEAVASHGLIDRACVHLFGQSMGGWAVLALLAETDVFCSGIAMASISNLISAHGQFDPRCRHDAVVHEHLSGRRMIEECWHLPGPPSQHLARYVRNSPVFSAARISAPVLLIHGDQDPVPMAQAEEMFSALRNEGKTVQLIRYWGEGHVLSSPANVRDAWQRISRWLDLHSNTAS